MKKLLMYLFVMSIFLYGCQDAPEVARSNYIEKSIQMSLDNISFVKENETVTEYLLPDEVKTGEFFKVEILNAPQGEKLYYSFLNKDNYINVIDGKGYAYIGVNYNTAVQLDTLGIYSGEELIYTKDIRISQSEFKEQRLYVSEELSEKRSSSNVYDDYKYTSKAKSESNGFPFFEGAFISPIEEYRESTSYGLIRYVNDKVVGRHSGLDMAVPRGTVIKAANSGVVTLAMELHVTGNTIIIDHGMYIFSAYAHLDELYVENGQYVEKGEVVGTVGSTGFSTGPHLHFTININGDYLNPKSFFDKDIMGDQ